MRLMIRGRKGNSWAHAGTARLQYRHAGGERLGDLSSSSAQANFGLPTFVWQTNDPCVKKNASRSGPHSRVLPSPPLSPPPLHSRLG